MIPIIMPQVGQDIPAGKIAQWLKDENDPVQAGEVVLIVESEKASFEVEAEASGVLLKIVHPEGREVPILQPVGYIGKPGERFDEAELAPAAAAPEGSIAGEGEGAEMPPPGRPAGRPLASPAARRLAREKGVDLSSLAGTGPEGRITKQDVLAADGRARPEEAPPVVQAGEGDEVVAFGKLRKRLAERLTASKRNIPHFHLLIDVDMTDAMQWRRAFNDAEGVHVTVTDMVVKAVAAGLKAFPRLNAHVDGEKMVLKANVNIGVAVAVEGGLLVPVIGDADSKGLVEISELLKKLAADARRGMVRPEPVGTFTVTSLGMHGVRQFLPIINPPECAILAVGSIVPRAVPVGDGMAVRQVMTLTLACDHRAADGADAAGLLNEIKAGLENVARAAKQWL